MTTELRLANRQVARMGVGDRDCLDVVIVMEVSCLTLSIILL